MVLLPQPSWGIRASRAVRRAGRRPRAGLPRWGHGVHSDGAAL